MELRSRRGPQEGSRRPAVTAARAAGAAEAEALVAAQQLAVDEVADPLIQVGQDARFLRLCEPAGLDRVIEPLLDVGLERRDQTVDGLALRLRDLRERLARLELGCGASPPSGRGTWPRRPGRAPPWWPKCPPPMPGGPKSGKSSEAIRAFNSAPCSLVSRPAATAASTRSLERLLERAAERARLHAELLRGVVDDRFALGTRIAAELGRRDSGAGPADCQCGHGSCDRLAFE